MPGDQNYHGIGRSMTTSLLAQEFDPRGEKMLKHAQEDGEAKAVARIHAERIAADAEATRYLAEMNCPNDIIEFGRNHKIERFAEATWQAGFMQGWRLAVARAGRENPKT